MGFSWIQKNISPIGIDFGVDSVKLLQVQMEDPPQLIAAASVDIPAEVRKDPTLRLEFLQETLRELVKEGRFKGKRAVISIPAAHMFVQHLRLGKNDDLPIQTQIEIELRGRVPLDPTRLVMRHVKVGDVFADGTAKQEIICLAASREAVMRHVEATTKAKLNVVGMHAEPLALLAAFGHLYRREDDVNRTTFFIDVGAATTKALIAHGRDLVFAKTIQVAGDHFNRHLAEQLKISESEARMRRIQQAAEQPMELIRTPGGTGHAGAVDGQNDRERRRPGQSLPMLEAAMAAEGAAEPAVEPMPEAAPLVSPLKASAATALEVAGGEMLDCLIDELQLCVGYHGSMFPDRQIEKIIFLGGEARQLGLCQQVARALRLPAQLGDPLARVLRRGQAAAPVGVDLRQPQPGWSVPLGLCMLPADL